MFNTRIDIDPAHSSITFDSSTIFCGDESIREPVRLRQTSIMVSPFANTCLSDGVPFFIQVHARTHSCKKEVRLHRSDFVLRRAHITPTLARGQQNGISGIMRHVWSGSNDGRKHAKMHGVCGRVPYNLHV